MRLIRVLSTIFLVATTGWPQPSMAVLCIAPGEHVAIEPGQERCAAPADLGKPDPSACTVGFTHTEACCAPCADLPLGSSVFVRASGSKDDLQQVKRPATAAASAAPFLFEPLVAERSFCASLHGAVPLSKPALQTVVLRC